ncbi:MAG: hypothetical protein ABJN40_05785 [Sneathiella sp.]
MRSEFILQIKKMYEDVMEGNKRYTDLQKFIDDHVIGDRLPEDLKEEELDLVHELQGELEDIAENQTSNAGFSTFYNQEKIKELLGKYKGFFEGDF